MGTMVSQITSHMIVYSTVYSGTDQRKHQSSVSLAFLRGIHRWPVNSLHKGPVTRKMFPFDNVMWTANTTSQKFNSSTALTDLVVVTYWFFFLVFFFQNNFMPWGILSFQTRTIWHSNFGAAFIGISVLLRMSLCCLIETRVAVCGEIYVSIKHGSLAVWCALSWTNGNASMQQIWELGIFLFWYIIVSPVSVSVSWIWKACCSWNSCQGNQIV